MAVSVVRVAIASLQTASIVPGQRLGVPALAHFSCSERPFDLFPGGTIPSVGLSEILLDCDASTVAKGALETPETVIDLDDVSAWGLVGELDKSTDLGSNKLRFGNANVLAAKLRPYLGKAFTNSSPHHLGSTEWIPLRVDEARLRPRLLAFLLHSEAYRRLASVFMSGKEHPRITPDVLTLIRVPLIPLPDQDALLQQLIALDCEARRLLDGLAAAPHVVSKVFEDFFGLRIADLAKARMCTREVIGLAGIAESRDVRFSFKYHSPSVRFARREIQQRDHTPISSVLAEPIVLGASISPDDYAEAGDAFYLSMASIKRWRFDSEDANRVSEAFFESECAKSVREGDIVMARSGEGTIGKVALVPANTRGVCADFTMRIRVDTEIVDRRFVFYFLMSDYFQELVYGEKKGLGNNTNIFPIQLKDMPLLMPDLSKQREVADEIDRRLASFEKDRAAIEDLRASMESVLSDAFSV